MAYDQIIGRTQANGLIPSQTASTPEGYPRGQSLPSAIRRRAVLCVLRLVRDQDRDEVARELQIANSPQIDQTVA